MFTGLVEEVGSIERIERTGAAARIVVRCRQVHRDAHLGDSVAINGVCLTVVEIGDQRLSFDAVPETMNRTNLGSLQAGSPVNLERPLQPSSRLGGHFVQGHVDGGALIDRIDVQENAHIFYFSVGPELARYLAPKGSVAVDGVSLTVVDATNAGFSVWIIPHTLANTRFKVLQPGDKVNIEVDILAKYVERMLSGRGEAGGVSYQKLQDAGYI